MWLYLSTSACVYLCSSCCIDFNPGIILCIVHLCILARHYFIWWIYSLVSIDFIFCVLHYFVYWVLCIGFYSMCWVFFPSYYTCQSSCQSSINSVLKFYNATEAESSKLFTHVNKHNTHASVSLAGLYESTILRSVTVISLWASIHDLFATALHISHGRQTSRSLCRSWLQLQGSIDWMYYSMCIWRKGYR